MPDTLIYWPIPTFDRTKGILERRTWYLELDCVPEQVKKEIVTIMELDRAESGENEVESKPGESEATLTYAKRDLRMLGYRQHFCQRPGFDFNTWFQQPGSWPKRAIPVNLMVEYFEDETGSRISKIDIYKAKTGEENPLIPFEPESVLRLGPSPIDPARTATEDDSDKIAHFLETAVNLARSSWYRSPPTLTLRTHDQEIDSYFPNPSETQGVVLALRQLYASDKLFNKAMTSYVKICGDARKGEWIGEIKKAFDKFLKGGSFLANAGTNVRELLDAFLYGSGIAHSDDRDQQERLRSLITKHGRPQVVMAVHATFRLIMDFVLPVIPVVAQDYEHWLKTGQCPKRRGMSIGELLSSGRNEPNTGQKPPTTPPSS